MWPHFTIHSKGLISREIAGKKCRNFFLLSFLILFISYASAAPIIESDVKLTNTSNANHPSWSPDGKKIAYAANQAIWIMNSDGSGQKKLYDGMAWEGDPVFNEDGSKIYFAAESKKAFSARYISIHVMNDDGNDGVKLTENADSRNPAVSPDGNRLVYVSRASGNYDIWTMSPNGSDNERLTDAQGDESSPSWSPDGNTIVYSAMGDIFTIGVNDVRPEQLTSDTYNNIEPVYSPDGNSIVYTSNIGGDYDLWILSADGSSHLKLTSDPSDEKAPSWSPDGSKIAYTSNRDGEFNIWVMTVENSNIELEEIEDDSEISEKVINSEYVLKLRDYAANNPRKFIGLVLLGSFLFVVMIVGTFLRKIS
jgi:TolB protein